MSTPPLVPPIKCQGIKTKLVGDIRHLVRKQEFDRWVEPFFGSCVVPLNLQPPKALLCDSNLHIVNLYRDIQLRKIGAANVREFLTDQGAALRAKGEDYFYEVRERFNSSGNSLDFLFLNRSLPIRLLPTPTKCGVHPFPGVQPVKGRRGCPARDSEQ